MKERLIDLMIENDVEWPEGAKFAAQDKEHVSRQMMLHFYKEKPARHQRAPYWSGDDVGDNCQMPSLCRNWHQTIVTREQYEAAQASAVRASDVREADVKPLSIEQKINMLNYTAATSANLLADSQRWERDAETLRAEIAADLAALGWGEQPTGNTGELEITDWRDLKDGDVVWWSGDSEYSPGEYIIDTLDYNDETMPILLEGGGWVRPSDETWRFISRP